MPNQSTFQKLDSSDNDTVVREPELSESVAVQHDPARSENSTASTMASTDHIEVVTIRGMPIHSISLRDTVEHIVDSCSAEMGGWVVTPNLDILRRFKRSPSFRNLVATSTLNVADGMPLVWASQIKGQPVPGRVNGTDLMVELCKASSASGLSVFFLGGNAGTADKTACEMKKRFARLEVAGTLCPDFGFESNMEALDSIANEIATSRPNIVFVGLGSPKQDVLINMLRLKFPNIWWLGVGVSFSFVAGELARAPDWAKNGLEWVFRLLVEPKRLAKRYLVDGIPFFATTVVACFWQRIFGKPKTKKSEVQKPIPANQS